MENKERGYKEERFDYVLYVNDNIICKRNFKIFNFIENSMNTLEFKNRIDEIVRMIENDLKSKSRVYTWYHFNPELPNDNEELVSPPIEPWSCTFKIVILDNKREVFTKIWDGYGYPKLIRDKVDISNKTVKLVSKDGKTYSYDKESFFKSNEDRLTFEQQVLKSMIMDKSDLLLQITKSICEVCSVHDNSFTSIGDYTLSESYGKDANGKDVKYDFNIEAYNRKLERKWMKLAAESSKKEKEAK